MSDLFECHAPPEEPTIVPPQAPVPPSRPEIDAPDIIDPPAPGSPAPIQEPSRPPPAVG